MAEFLPLGAILQSWVVNGVNIVQGFVDQEDYEKFNQPYFGETIGRVANRVSAGKIDDLNGKSYQLAVNNGPNSLHGGVKGWGKRVWKESSTPMGGEQSAVVYELDSEHMDEGYPGHVRAFVTYTPSLETVNGKQVHVLDIAYRAELVGDEVKETAINMTNHSYFNISGDPTSITGTKITLSTDDYLPVDDGGIPSGQITSFKGVKKNESFVLGASEPDIDDCFVVDRANAELADYGKISTKNDPLKLLVTASHPNTGITLEVHSTDPAFQFYTGKYIDVPEVKDGAGGVKSPARGARSGFCVEPSRFVNAVNVPWWESQVVLKKGEVYDARIVYKAWADSAATSSK